MLECPDLDLESRTLALRLLLRGGKDGERGIDGFFAGGGTGRVVRAEMLKCAVEDGDIEEFLNLGRFWREN